MFALTLLHWFLINCRLQYEGTLKYLGESVTGIKIGMQNLHSSLSIDGWGNRLGMSADAKTSQYDSTAHVQRLFLPKWRSRQLWHHLMMSLSSCLHKWRGRYKRKHVWVLGILLVLGLILVGSSSEFWSGKPQTLYASYLGASQGVGSLPYREVFLFIFMCSRLSWVPWVSVLYLLVSRPGSSSPCIYWTWYRRGKDHSPSEWSVHMG